jgi:protein N-terminal asparagine amidohydrolase
VGVHVKNGTIFPANFLDKGPDMDMRTARILTGGEKVGMLDIYSSEREELRVGPFSYLPMRSVDIWLDQSDDFILQSLCPCPDVVPDKGLFVRQVRDTLRLVKSHPYPSVTLFHSNAPRSYRKDDISGHWIPTGQTGLYIPFPPQGCGKMEPQPAFQDDLCLNFKQENFLPWQTFPTESQIYY